MKFNCSQITRSVYFYIYNFKRLNHWKVESTRYPTETVRIAVKATYKPTMRQVAADLV